MTKQEQLDLLSRYVAEDDAVAEAIMQAIQKIARDNPGAYPVADQVGYWTINLTDED